MTAPDKHKFATLDAMRGVAALAVVLFHFRKTLRPVDGVLLFESGYLAVDLFFLLSGFVIAFAYDDRLAAGMRFRDFLLQRMIRLLPMIWVGVAIGTAYLLDIRAASRSAIAATAMANGLILPGATIPSRHPFAADGAEWSLFFEIVANLLYAAAFRYLTSRVLILIIAAALVGLVATAITYRDFNHGYTLHGSWVGFSRVGFSFFLGVMLSRTRRSWAPRLRRVPSWAVLLLCAVVLFIPVYGATRAVYDLMVAMMASPLLVMAGSNDEPIAAVRPAAAFLAAISYPIYAVHQPVRDWIMLAATNPHQREAIAASVIALLLPVSALLAYAYDVPLRRWLTRQYRSREADKMPDAEGHFANCGSPGGKPS